MGSDCAKVREQIDPLVDGELEKERQAEIEEHFKHCVPCLRIYQLVTGVKKRIFGACNRTKAPDYLRERILQSLEDEAFESKRTWSWKGWLAWAPAPAVAAVVVAVVALALLNPGSVQSHNFTEISLEAYQRLQNKDVKVLKIGSPAYRVQLAAAQLPGNSTPSLEEMGYELNGCCFGLNVDHPAGHYLFRTENGKELSLVEWRAASEEDHIEGQPLEYAGRKYTVFREGDFNLVLWKNGEIFCSVFGELEQEHVLQAADILRQQGI